ncbi:hypothetical protein [Hymenobacter sp. CRA2]|uniref:hypothetical protein n=1 Tax=Hymenobacter sp. CRA2 TaxID=1955620 RepID=UPI00098F0B4B|nr:hypothetical protein [Hymenobacter sp. CRA2]OON68435.1 hypothetical protein B0919_12305 [Hymenobacter sp. CRA2]
MLAPAYYVLLEKGYTVKYDQKTEWYTAEKDGVKLGAYDPIQLCGIAYVYEAKGNDWRVSDEAIEAFMQLEQPKEPFYPYDSMG